MSEKTPCKSCEFCERHGLPILPVRPSIISQNDPCARVPSEIAIPIEAQGQTAYTLRLLRSGFLNIWDETTCEWINYYLTEAGYYYPLDPDGSAFPSLLNGKVKPCINEPSELATASFITLPLLPPPFKNGVFWFSWSQTAWTSTVRKRHEDADYRERYMQRFDVEDWLQQSQGQQALPISSIKQVVAEYNDERQHSQAKKWSPFPWKKLELLAGYHILVQAQKLAGKAAAILVLNDPLALTQEISHLMDYELKAEVTQKEEFSHEIFTSAAIETIENIVNETTEQNLLQDFHTEFKVSDSAGDYYLISPSAQQFQKKKVQLVQKQAQEWAKYRQYFDEEKLAAFKKKQHDALTEYKLTTYTPRTELYLAWFKSSLFIDYFTHNFDDDNLDSGIDYTFVFADSLIGIQENTQITREINELLCSPSLTASNIVARALYLNQKSLIEKVQKATANIVDYSKLPWDTILASFEELINPKKDHISIIMSLYLGNIAGAASHCIYKVLSSKTVFHSMIALGALNNKAIVVIQYESTFKHFLSYSVKEMIRTLGIHHRSSPDWMRSGVQKKLLSYQMKEFPLDEKVIKPRIICMDLNEFQAIKALPVKEKSKQAYRILLSKEELRNKQYVEWQRKLTSSKGKLENASGTLLGIVISLIQFNNISKSANYEKTNLTQDQLEAQIKHYANIAALFSTVMKTAEEGIKKFNLVALFPTRFSFIAKSVLFRHIGKLAKGLGFAAGFIFAAFDFKNAATELSKGNYSLAASYALSGTSSFVLLFAGYFCPILIVICVLTLIISNIYILLNEQNKMQKWLESCLWRVIPDQRKKSEWPAIWPSTQRAVSEFNLALEVEA